MKTLTFELYKTREHRNALYLRLVWDALKHDTSWDDYVDVQICNGVVKIISTNDDIVKNIKESLDEMFD